MSIRGGGVNPTLLSFRVVVVGMDDFETGLRTFGFVFGCGGGVAVSGGYSGSVC